MQSLQLKYHILAFSPVRACVCVWGAYLPSMQCEYAVLYYQWLVWLHRTFPRDLTNSTIFVKKCY